jgi:glycosyltransferase involved in cell wall biosynthesis
MKILHLATFLQGGAGRVIADLAVAQRAAGHDVTVVASRTGVPGYGNYDAYLNRLEFEGVSLRLVDSLFARDHAANLQVVRALDEMFPAGSEPAIVHTHAAMPSLIAMIYAGGRRTSPAIVQTMHGWGVEKTAQQADMDVAVINRVDRVVVPSRHSREILTSLGVAAARVNVVPYGVAQDRVELGEIDEGAFVEMAHARHRGALIVACVGTIGARKNQALLVDAIGRLRGRLSIHGVIFGDGETAALQQRIDAARLADVIRVHGYSSAARRLAASADLLVLPSQSEGQPLSILEAFCDGTLVAVSDIPELAELVDDGRTGLRFAAGDTRALADALIRFAALSNAERRGIRARARGVYEANFTVAQMTQSYELVYGEVLRASADRPARVRAGGRRRVPPAA